MTAGKMMAGVRRAPPLLMLELEVTRQVPRKEEVMEPAASVEKRDTLLGSVLRGEEGTTSAGTAGRLVLSKLPVCSV